MTRALDKQAAEHRSRWAEFYKGREGDSYLHYFRARYAVFIAHLSVLADENCSYYEIGCGTATTTRALMDTLPKGIHFAASDIDRQMVEIAQRRCGPRASVFRGDAFLCPIPRSARLSKFIVHSHGLLEHFADGDIRRMVDAYSHCAQMHYVPGEYDKPTFGEDRLLPAAAWSAILGTRLSRISTFNGGLDYILHIPRRRG